MTFFNRKGHAMSTREIDRAADALLDPPECDEEEPEDDGGAFDRQEAREHRMDRNYEQNTGRDA